MLIILFLKGYFDMIMLERKLKILPTDVLLVAFSAVFFIGLLTFAAPCGAKADGTYMSCHYLGVSVAAVAATATFISVVHLVFADNGVKIGLSIADFALCVLACLLAFALMDSCGMSNMRCNAVTKPFVLVMSVVTAISSAVDFCYRLFVGGGNKK